MGLIDIFFGLFYTLLVAGWLATAGGRASLLEMEGGKKKLEIKLVQGARCLLEAPAKSEKFGVKRQ